MTKEMQGQEMCRDVLVKTHCEVGPCVTLCTQKWDGNGTCLQNGQIKRCLCTFPCKI